jgi:hypothetical protein
MSRFVERERKSGLEYIADLQATVRQIYQSACKHDGLPEDTKFAIFSKDNPFVPFYEKAISQSRDAMREYSEHGYCGMQIVNGRAQLYKRAAKRKKKADT